MIPVLRERQVDIQNKSRIAKTIKTIQKPCLKKKKKKISDDAYRV